MIDMMVLTPLFTDGPGVGLYESPRACFSKAAEKRCVCSKTARFPPQRTAYCTTAYFLGNSVVFCQLFFFNISVIISQYFYLGLVKTITKNNDPHEYPGKPEETIHTKRQIELPGYKKVKVCQTFMNESINVCMLVRCEVIGSDHSKNSITNT